MEFPDSAGIFNFGPVGFASADCVLGAVEWMCSVVGGGGYGGFESRGVGRLELSWREEGRVGDT